MSRLWSTGDWHNNFYQTDDLQECRGTPAERLCLQSVVSYTLPWWKIAACVGMTTGKVMSCFSDVMVQCRRWMTMYRVCERLAAKNKARRRRRSDWTAGRYERYMKMCRKAPAAAWACPAFLYTKVDILYLYCLGKQCLLLHRWQRAGKLCMVAPYDLPKGTHFTFRCYDIAGHEVHT